MQIYPGDYDDEIERRSCRFFFRHHPFLLCFVFVLAMLYNFFFSVFAFLLASSPVLLLTAFLLGVVLVYSEPNVPEEDHVYKKIRRVQNQSTATSRRQRSRDSDSAASSDSSAEENRFGRSTATSLTSFPDIDDISESETESEPEHPEEKEQPVKVVAWTAEDEKSIRKIGSLELERNATMNKLIARRRATRVVRRQHLHTADLIDLSADGSKLNVATRNNPFDADQEEDFPSSAPVMFRSRNPFFDDSKYEHPDGPPSSPPQRNAMLFRRHESFTVGAPFASDFRPSRFRPYFVTEADKMRDQTVRAPIPEASSKSSSASSSSSVTPANKEEEEAAAAAILEESKIDERRLSQKNMAAVDVELISDSSDDDVSLPAHDDEMKQQMPAESTDLSLSDEDSFEVESINKQLERSTSGKLQKQQEELQQPEAAAAAGTGEDQNAAEESSSGEAWVAPSKLGSVEENEAMEAEVTEISEQDILAPLPDASGKDKAAAKTTNKYLPLNLAPLTLLLQSQRTNSWYGTESL